MATTSDEPAETEITTVEEFRAVSCQLVDGFMASVAGLSCRIRDGSVVLDFDRPAALDMLVFEFERMFSTLTRPLTSQPPGPMRVGRRLHGQIGGRW